MTGPAPADGPRASTLSWDPNLVAALSYLLGAVSGAVVLAVEKKNDFVRFHAAQSIAYSLAVSLVVLVLSGLPIIGRGAPQIGALVAVIPWFYLMFKAIKGDRYKLPYLGDIVDRQLR